MLVIVQPPAGTVTSFTLQATAPPNPGEFEFTIPGPVRSIVDWSQSTDAPAVVARGRRSSESATANFL